MTGSTARCGSRCPLRRRPGTQGRAAPHRCSTTLHCMPRRTTAPKTPWQRMSASRRTGRIPSCASPSLWVSRSPRLRASPCDSGPGSWAPCWRRSPRRAPRHRRSRRGPQRATTTPSASTRRITASCMIRSTCRTGRRVPSAICAPIIWARTARMPRALWTRWPSGTGRRPTRCRTI